MKKIISRNKYRYGRLSQKDKIELYKMRSFDELAVKTESLPNGFPIGIPLMEVISINWDECIDIEQIAEMILNGKLDIADVPEEMRTKNKMIYIYAFRRFISFLSGQLSLKNDILLNMRVNPFLLIRYDINFAPDDETANKLKNWLAGYHFIEERYGYTYEYLDKYQIIAITENKLRDRKPVF